MAGENLGTESQTEENATGAQENAEAQAALLDGNKGAGDAANPEGGSNGVSATPDNGTEGEVSHESAEEDFKAQLAERDAEIARLKAEAAEAAKQLNERIAELEAKAERERTDFELRLAGCRSTRAARALLDDHDGDIAKLKEAEPWLFDTEGEVAHGVTGLPNAGAAANDDATLKHWREIAGLDD